MSKRQNNADNLSGYNSYGSLKSQSA